MRCQGMRVQGESLPLWGTVGQLMDQLTAAGVGERPVVFVCHRHAIPFLPFQKACSSRKATLQVMGPKDQ